jgi:hypothetical protein
MDEVKSSSRRPYYLAAAVFFLGGFLFFMIATLGTRNNLRVEQAAFEDFPRIPVPAEEQPVELEKADRLVIFVEHPSEEAADLVDVALFWETGQPVSLLEPTDIRPRQIDGNNSVPYAEFAIEQTGTYLLNTALLADQVDPPPMVALGPWPQSDGSLLLIVVGWGGLFLCLLGGPLIALRAFIMRRRHPAAAG